MNLIISGHHFELTDKVKNMVTQKVESKLHGFLPRLHNITIVLTQEKLSIASECTITSDFGEFFAHAAEEQLETSIDKTLAKVLSEIKKKHDKIVTHK